MVGLGLGMGVLGLMIVVICACFIFLKCRVSFNPNDLFTKMNVLISEHKNKTMNLTLIRFDSCYKKCPYIIDILLPPVNEVAGR